MRRTTARHPVERTAAIPLSLGCSFVAIAGTRVLVSSGSLLADGAVFGIGLMFVALGAHAHLSGPLAMKLNLSSNAVQLGRFDEARGLLADVEARFGSRSFARAILVQRAQLALHAGQTDEALGLFERAASLPLGILNRWFARMQRSEALASAALLRATSGDVDGARAQIARVRGEPSLAPALARATVAELVLLARAGDHAALREVLEAKRSLLFEATAPRERALVRAVDRMLEAAARTPYREPGESLGARTRTDGVTGWISDAVPGAEAYVAARDVPSGTGVEVRFAAPSAEAAARVERDRKMGATAAGRPLLRRTLALWVLLMVMFLAIWQFLQPGVAAPAARSAAPPDPSAWPVSTFLMILVGVLVAVVVWSTRRVERGRESVRAGALALVEGDHDRARRLIGPALTAQQLTPKAEAWLLIAQIEEREADFAKSLVACDTALGFLGGRGVRAASYDLLLPALHAQRAFVLAVLGRQDEANAEMTLLGAEFPSYALRGVADLRVKLAELAHAGDRAGAAALGRDRSPYVQVGRREEALLDLVDALDVRGNPDERTRLRHQLDRDRRLGAWLGTVSPALVAELTASGRAA